MPWAPRLNAKIEDADVEHRCGYRWSMNATVVIQTLQGATAKATMQNVSASGALLQCRMSVPLHSQVRVIFPALAAMRRGALAQVVRQSEDGLAIEWSEFSPQIVQHLLSLQASSQPPALAPDPLAR
jgi:PilZ domain